MNQQLVKTLIAVIRSLSPEEQSALWTELLDFQTPQAVEVAEMAIQGGSFDFLESEPELYQESDGEAIS